VTPDRSYEFLQMPFGMKNLGATLVQGMQKVLAGLSNMESYIDDFIIYNDDWTSHIVTLSEVFQRLAKVSLNV